MKIFISISVLVGLCLLAILTGVPQYAGERITHWQEREAREWMARVEAAGGDPIKAIDLSNGIDKFEASSAASAYFFRYVSGCGFPTRINDRGTYWEVEKVVGIAGKDGDSIRIMKETGIINSAGFPEVTIEALKAEPNQIGAGNGERLTPLTAHGLDVRQKNNETIDEEAPGSPLDCRGNDGPMGGLLFLERREKYG